MIRVLSDLLVESTKLHPQKTAIIDGDQKLTYAELEALSNQVAHGLKAKGVKEGDLVGILAHKNLASIVAIFGILKAGAGYVPVDTNAPAKLITYYIDNSEINCLFTTNAFLGLLSEVPLETTQLSSVILLQEETGDHGLPCEVQGWQGFVNNEPDSVVQNTTIDSKIAYILYTSGSTGQPKGAVTSHRNALAFVDSCHFEYHVTQDDVVANPAPLKFGISIFDIFVTIKTGATMIIIPQGLVTFPMQLTEWIESNGVTTWFSVPFILSRMALDGEMNRFKFEKLKTIFFAGEVFPVKYLTRLMNLVPHATYYNIYGTTETNILTQYKVPELDPEGDKPIPVGRSFSNLEVFALKDNGELVSKDGEEGEICVRGAMVTLGYWKNPERTAQSYVQNPLNKNYNEIIYKTGDLARLDGAGNFHFLGRKGLMIKSRGYRIETGEIEATLYAYAGVKEAVVVGVPDDLQGNIVKAVVTLQPDEEPNGLKIKAFCRDRIPVYMVPEIIEFRESLPKTSTGKVDRISLIKPV